MQNQDAIRTALEKLEIAIATARKDRDSRTSAGSIDPYWEKPVPDISRLEGSRDALRWVLGK